MTAADVLVEALIDWGVEVIFGLPGDGINGIMESLRTHQDKIRFVQVRHEEAAAFMACHGVSHITFPVDLQEKEIKERQRYKRNVPHHTSDAYARSARLPDRVDLERAAEILNRGKKVAILAGRGALNATDELEQTAELLAAPIVKALLGKAAVPDDSPYTTGGIGLLGTKPSQEAMEDCDTLLMVGTSFPYIEFMPKPGQARGVQIELDPKRIDRKSTRLNSSHANISYAV